MKIIDFVNNQYSFSIPITNEEHELLKKFTDSEIVKKSDLNEREAHLANSLVHKDILLRKNENEKNLYKRKLNL